MPQTTNSYFNQFNSAREQDLLNNLIRESIQIYGLEVLYIPRKYVNVDRLYGEDTLSAFEKYYRIESYVANFDAYQGDGEFYSKFGIEVRNEISLNMHIDRFDELVNQPHLAATGTDLLRPREGDLIYFPVDDRIFEISFSEKRSIFFQLGKLYMWLIRAKQFELASEKMATTFAKVDDIEDLYDQALTVQVSSGFGDYTLGEEVLLGNFKAQVSHWDNVGMILKIIRPNGDLPSSGNLTGQLSGATYSIVPGTVTENANEVIHNTQDVHVAETNGFILPTANPLANGPNQ